MNCELRYYTGQISTYIVYLMPLKRLSTVHYEYLVKNRVLMKDLQKGSLNKGYRKCGRISDYFLKWNDLQISENESTIFLDTSFFGTMNGKVISCICFNCKFCSRSSWKLIFIRSFVCQKLNLRIVQHSYVLQKMWEESQK